MASAFEFARRIAKPPDYFLGLGERPIGHGQLPARESNASAEGAWQATLGSEQCAVLHPLFDQLAHPGHFPLGRRNALFGAFIRCLEISWQSPCIRIIEFSALLPAADK
jgi:hypothetical protein